MLTCTFSSRIFLISPERLSDSSTWRTGTHASREGRGKRGKGAAAADPLRWPQPLEGSSVGHANSGGKAGRLAAVCAAHELRLLDGGWPAPDDTA